MKIVIVYVGYSGYFCACCRALKNEPGVDLKVFAMRPGVPFADDVLRDVPLDVVTEADYADCETFSRRVLSEKPDVILTAGWQLKVVHRMLHDRRFASVRFLAAMDTSWKMSLRQILARVALRRFVKHVAGVIVGGERGRLFARWIGFPNSRIFISTYGLDTALFSAAENPRSRVRSFLYVARYVPQKGLDTLIAAYRKYRSLVSDPWPLNCYGSGPLRELLQGVEGVHEHGFAQPKDLPEIFSRNGVYVLPSLNEPWGVSLAEAATAGMPLICSHMVTSGVDVVRHLYNGLVFTAGDVDALARCLLWCHAHHDRLANMGAISRTYGAAYSAELWAERIVWAAKCVLAQ